MTIGARAKNRTQAEAKAAADAAATWLLVGGSVLAVLTALFGSVAPGFPLLVAVTYAVASGVCLAKHRTAKRWGRRFLLVPLTALLLACVPTITHSSASTWIASTLLVLIVLLVLFVFPVLVDFALQRVPAAHTYSVVVFAGAACFAVSGLDVLISLFLIPIFVVTAGFAIARCAATGQHAAGRLVFAATIGFGVAWLGLHQQTPSIWTLPRPEHAPWFVDYPADAAHYQTLMVAGFPIQRIEGHGGGGAREYLPWQKGLGVLLANYLICTGAAWLAACWIPVRALISATATGIVFSIVAGLTGWWRLLVMLD
tara:strand:+ start:42415 stop:43353 length:939 start_codon:yes stop_codon:yes gene_type:complete